MVMPKKPSLLYISPVIPALTGNGLAMRAGTVLEVLAQRHDLHLLVVPLYASVTPRLPEPLEKMCRRAEIASPRQRQRGGLLPAGIWGVPRFDVVHVFRLATLPFSRPYLGRLFRRPRRHLDLDDIESLTHRRLASLYRQNGDSAMAAREESEAARCETREDEVLRTFDRVYVCSASDRSRLAGRARADLRVLLNGVRMPANVPARPAGEVFTFLFVGTLGYYPNEDAVRFLCAEILPRLRELAGDKFVVNIVGTGASESLRQAASVAGVRFIGPVADLGPWYAQSHAIVAPIRAGGGTRIKILEAFSYRRPVVATSMAMEGIDAHADEHAVIGDTSAAFAQQCARLMADGDLCDRLARNALDLVEQRYSLQALRRALEEMP